MRNFYLYLAGVALLASGAEMISKISGDPSSAQTEWVGRKQNQSDRKENERVPFARARKRSGTKALLAPSISATNTYAITNNVGPAGASAGDELEYTVVITNGGPDPASNTAFNETIDINTTLVPGSVKASPIAQNDSYVTIGNVNITVPVGTGLFANDISPAATALSLSSSTNITTSNGGTVVITAATGAFTYQPAAGFTGNDTFTYDIQNGSGMTSSATVTIAVGNGAGNAIWFINSSAAAGGNGTLASPFNTMAAFQAINDGGTNHAKDSHVIFMYSGSYDGNITFRNNQKLFGQGATSSLITLTGFAQPSGTDLIPATGGTRPLLTNGAGNVLTVDGTTTVRGLNIGNSSGAKINSSNSGTFTASEINLTGTGTAINLSGKALAATFGQVSSSVSGGTSPIKISSGSGNLTISSGTLTATSVPALDIAGSVALTVTLDAVNANGGNKGMIVSGTTGSLQVTGSGTTGGSGGTIQNIVQRGIELVNATNITLKNMNLTSANTSDGATASNQDNSGANAAVYASGVNGLTMDRVVINGTVTQEGVNLWNSSNFNFTNGSIGTAGDLSQEGSIYAVNTGGTNSIVNSTFTDPGGRAVFFSNNSTDMALLTVDNSTFQDSNNSGLQFFGYGDSDMKLKVQNSCKFLRNPTVGVYVGANEQAVIQADIKNSTVDVGNGVGRTFDLAAVGTATLKFNVTGNTGNFNGGIGINMFAFAGGYLEGNVVGNTLTNKPSSSGVSAISIDTQGATGRGTFNIENNTILNTIDAPGIATLTTSSSGAQTNVHVVGNSVQVFDSGDNIFNGIDLATTSAAGNNSKLCIELKNNAVSIPADHNALRTRSASALTTVLLHNSGTPSSSLVQVWNTGGNTPQNSVLQSGAANPYLYNQTCPTTSVSPLREAMEPSPERVAAITEESAAPNIAPQVAAGTPSAEPSREVVSEPAVQTARPARTEAVQAGETVTVNGSGSGFTLPAGKNTTIKFRVTINADIPVSDCEISTQGTVSGSNFADVLTDDPNIPGTNNPTVTTITSVPVITFCPGNQTFSPDAGTCTSTQTFAATADACPVATITYSVGGNPIAFPYAFPAGETTVLVTASNGIGTAPTCSFTVTVTPTPAPPITDEPDAQTICAGASTSFTVASSQAGVTYQWQKKPFGGSFADITVGSNPTADDATLTLSNVPAADNQSEYRCIISNPCNTSTSAAALLTVNQITGSSLTGTTTVNQGATAPVVTFEATGGTLPYTFTYQVNGGSNQTVSTTGVQTTATVSQPTGTVGVFTYELVSVTDAQSCSLTPPSAQTAAVTVANNLTATISGATEVCKDNTEPVITFTAVNGIAPFTFSYTINGGPVLQTTTTGSNTSATVNAPTNATGAFVYNLTNVSGAGGATTAITGQSATVNVGQNPTIAISGQEYLCSGDLNTYTVYFTATPGAVITTNKGTVDGNTVTGVPSKETAVIVATLGNCTDTLMAFRDCSLPVTLVDFIGSKTENTISLNWRTTEETNSDRFEIQRSTNGKNWAAIGTEKSHGESSSLISYKFVDQQPAQGNNYYRLKMVDLDKTFAYSKIIKISFNDLVLKSEFYPNPVSDVLYLKSTDWNQVKSVEMHNMIGATVYKSGETVSKTIDVKNLAVGMYILTITHENGEVSSRKVLINR
ncbi:Ig-like domain-containing protein [Dyadobacter sp. CY261]|uniref:Ig-like domain-containing protein n=1 Tax=Dyadobacter sp. CY261 TaxID=2907203 RepID=UPI001F34FE71|nr:T9SS type A sorting domain-containing protein [Dyadobacter sp. CY261]MCF0070239.1 Ig-like domain-containing protein [Dyadobacter sp. CY261]